MLPRWLRRLHIVIGGRPPGAQRKPLMLFVHGFPELWYSWRHQLKVRMLQPANSVSALLEVPMTPCRCHRIAGMIRISRLTTEHAQCEQALGL